METIFPLKRKKKELRNWKTEKLKKRQVFVASLK